ncbi:YjjG family noncanonical pyrimidine nucleotidase [Leeuwenhoekiella sp. A16]|uniref:YjjG family noncanonical pyrimidine nucleotidase n=1 Tax=Leeuwenhoekiella sp. A16 TaxID=3141462 RepID=UPI003A80A398
MSKILNIKHVFFDLDHTIWDFDKNSAMAFDSIFIKNRIDIETSKFLEEYIPINFQYWKYFREGQITKEQLRYSRLKKSFDNLNIEIDDHLINKLADDYIAFLPDNNHLFEGTLALLEYLNNHYHLHIITNGFEEVQLKKLKNSKIDHFFKSVTTSESVGVKKPDPKIFRYALEIAEATHAESVMIGDTYEADILGARGVGMQTICFNYHKANLHSDERVVNTLPEILNYL